MIQRILFIFIIISALLVWALMAPELPLPVDAVAPIDTEHRAPAYHVPMTCWRSRHGLMVARTGHPYERYISQGECRQCHQPNTFCGPCHGYVGVRVKRLGESS